MKKIFSLFLVLSLLFPFFGLNKNGSKSSVFSGTQVHALAPAIWFTASMLLRYYKKEIGGAAAATVATYIGTQRMEIKQSGIYLPGGNYVTNIPSGAYESILSRIEAGSQSSTQVSTKVYVSAEDLIKEKESQGYYYGENGGQCWVKDSRGEVVVSGWLFVINSMLRKIHQPTTAPSFKGLGLATYMHIKSVQFSGKNLLKDFTTADGTIMWNVFCGMQSVRQIGVGGRKRAMFDPFGIYSSFNLVRVVTASAYLN